MMFRVGRVLLCLAAVTVLLAAVPPVRGDEPPVETEPQGPQNPAAFSPASITPVEVGGAVAAVVDLAEVPISPDRPGAGEYRAHLQGEFAQHQPIPSHRLPISSSDRGEPTVEVDFRGPGGLLPAEINAPGAGVTAFEGVPASGWIPPDTVAAAGPEYVVEAVNSGFLVYTKTGVQTRGYTDFETFVNLPSPWNGFCYDPRVVFDPWSDQFVMLILGLDLTNLKSYFWIMVSKTSNPNGEWWLWRYDSTTGDPGSEEWLDYASLGSDPWGLYVVGNSYGFAQASGFQQSRLWTLNRDLMNGGASNGIFFNGLRWPNNDPAFSPQVAQAQSVNSSQATFFINNYSGSGTQVCLWKFTGERYVGQGLGDAALDRAAIDARVYYGIFNNVDQPGSDWDIDGGDCRIQNAVYSQGKVYTTFGLDFDGSHSYSEVYVAAFNTGDSTKAWDFALWNSQYFMFYPALAIEGGDLEPNWMVAMSMTVPGDPIGFAGSIAVTHDPSTDTGSFWWDRMGLGPYSVWDGGGEGLGRNRWGDYSMAFYDWTCRNAWGATEYATDSNSWATRIFARTMDDEAPCPYVHVVSPNGGESVAAGGDVLVEWNSMNVPSSDELWVRFDSGAAIIEYGPLAAGTTSYTWTVPEVDTPSASLQVGAWNPAGISGTLSTRATGPSRLPGWQTWCINRWGIHSLCLRAGS